MNAKQRRKLVRKHHETVVATLFDARVRGFKPRGQVRARIARRAEAGKPPLNSWGYTGWEEV